MSNRRRLAGLVMCLTIILAVPGTAAGVAGFGDVEHGRFYTEAVQWMVDKGITTGTSSNCFSPDDSVTRGQAAAFLWRMEGFSNGAPPHPFNDVVAAWQQEPVSWMYDEGITTGTSPTTFAPADTLTRGQMAALIYRAAGEPAGAPPHPFVDVSKQWQEAPVSWMADAGITTGTSPVTFSPDDPVTRGQFATFAWRWKGEPPVVVEEYTPLCGRIDNFDGSLQAGWTWFGLNGAYTSLTDFPGNIAMAASPGGVVGLDRALVAENYLIETKVRIQPGGNFASAGLQSGNGVDVVLLDRDYCELAGCTGDAIYLTSIVDEAFDDGFYFPIPAETGDVYLSLSHVDGLWIGAFSLDGTTWEEVGRVQQVIDGATYGIDSGFSDSDPVPTARFDWFKETPL